MQREMLGKQDDFHDLRQMFMEADADYSGFLTIDELFNCIQSMGLQVTMEDVTKLMAEVDMDKDAKLDINEFITFM